MEQLNPEDGAGSEWLPAVDIATHRVPAAFSVMADRLGMNNSRMHGVPLWEKRHCI